MSQPTNYTPTTDFSQQEAINASGRSTVNTAALDTEFANIELTLDQALSNLAQIQRDDGRLKDVIVDVYTLSPDVLNLMGGFNLRGLWATATAYALNDICSNGAYTYVCRTAHTSSGSFDSSKWIQFGFTSGADAAAAAAAAQVSATSASGSASAASASATAAANSASSASSSASSASTSATTATTKASESLSSATSAANSASAAAASAAAISYPIAVANGGTGSTTASAARTALGLTIGSDVQGYTANASQVEMESGTEVNNRMMSPLRVRQAIDSTKDILTIGASVASNALTLTLSPRSLSFRSATLASGAVNQRTIGSTISLVVPSGASIGTVAATSARLALLAIDNAGTVELAVVNLAGGNNLDETTLISTTAISAAATAANVIYSTTARTNVPFRVVGFIDITEATAGTWATAPTTIQGGGGQALAAMSSLGHGQSWQDVTGSRAVATTYYNTTGKPILVKVSKWAGSVVNGIWSATVNGVKVGYSTQPAAASGIQAIDFLVPPGASYLLTQENGTTTPGIWAELR